MDILPIQGLAVPCEWVFSLAKETMTACHNNLLPSLMELLQLFNYSLWMGQSLDFTDWMKEDVERQAMESILEVRNHPLDKHDDFLQSFGEDWCWWAHVGLGQHVNSSLTVEYLNTLGWLKLVPMSFVLFTCWKTGIYVIMNLAYNNNFNIIITRDRLV